MEDWHRGVLWGAPLTKGARSPFPGVWASLGPHTYPERETRRPAALPLDTLPECRLSHHPTPPPRRHMGVSCLPVSRLCNWHILGGTTSCLLNGDSESSCCWFVHLFCKYLLCQALGIGRGTEQTWPLPSGADSLWSRKWWLSQSHVNGAKIPGRRGPKAGAYYGSSSQAGSRGEAVLLQRSER